MFKEHKEFHVTGDLTPLIPKCHSRANMYILGCFTDKR